MRHRWNSRVHADNSNMEASGAPHGATGELALHSCRVVAGLALLAWLLAVSGQQPQDPAAGLSPQARAATRPRQSASLYAGTDTCRPCHARQFRTFPQSAHWLTSAAVSPRTVAAGFPRRPIEIPSSNPELRFVIGARDGSLFQTAITGLGANERPQTERVAVVVGSGKRGQSFLWRRGPELFQLPLSYWTEARRWAISPGFSDQESNFSRSVTPACLDCHATAIDSLPEADSHYDLQHALLGVGCEKCHGPAAAHVTARRSGSLLPPSGGPDVVNPARFSREQHVDLCGSCHGARISGRPFSYVPGDPVQWPRRPSTQRTASDGGSRPQSTVAIALDSHGQQATALRESRCFLGSSMTCETCHEAHVTQRDPRVLSARCQTCHEPQACGAFAREGRRVVGRCVDCHMPVQDSGVILSTGAAGTIRVKMRSHRIAVYREAAGTGAVR
jgi:hypothetical protein